MGKRGHLDRSRGVLGALLGVFASLVVLSERGVARLVRDDRREYWRRRRSIGGLAGVDAGGELALGDEVGRALLRDDLEIIGSTGVCEVDGRRGPLSEDDGPLLLSHGDVLGVVVPGIAEVVELSLEFVGDGRDEGVVGVREEVLGAEESEGFVSDDIVDLSPDLWSDGGCVGHSVVAKEEFECFYEGEEGGSWVEATCVIWWKLRVLPRRR